MTTKTATKTTKKATMLKTTPELKARAVAIAEKTADAFSWDNYGAERWEACTLMLLRRGYTEREAEAILRSKWTRWAGDMASDRKGWRYGRTTANDLARFLDTMKTPDMKRDVAELVLHTFSE